MNNCIDLTEDNYQTALQTLMHGVSLGGQVMVVKDKGEEIEANLQQRKLAQNDLMWAWNNEIAKRTGQESKEVHGSTKFIILLPMYLSWGGAALKRGLFVQHVIDHVPKYEHKVAVAYDMVRTKNLSTKRMADYLSNMQKHYAEAGIVLQSNGDLEFKSLLVEMEGRL